MLPHRRAATAGQEANIGADVRIARSRGGVLPVENSTDGKVEVQRRFDVSTAESGELHGTPPTTAVRQPLEALGRELGTSLVKLIVDDAPVRHLVVATTRQVRHTSAHPESDTHAAILGG